MTGAGLYLPSLTTEEMLRHPSDPLVIAELARRIEHEVDRADEGKDCAVAMCASASALAPDADALEATLRRVPGLFGSA